MCSSPRRIPPRSRASSPPSPARPPRWPSAPHARAMCFSISTVCLRTWGPPTSPTRGCASISLRLKSPVTSASTPSRLRGLKLRPRSSRASRFRLSPCFLRPLWWRKSSSRWMSPPPCKRGAPHRPRTSASPSPPPASPTSSSARRKDRAAVTLASSTLRSSEPSLMAVSPAHSSA